MTESSVMWCDTGALWAPMVEAGFVNDLRRHIALHIAPEADSIDKEDRYPVAIVKHLAKQGYCTVTLAKQFGGMGLGYQHAVAVCEEVGATSGAVGVSLITIFQAQSMIQTFGKPSLQERYLPEFAKGLLTSYALTESNHGSDIRQLDTKAARSANGWIISGEKHFITSGSAAEMFIILAQTDVGVSVFAVPRDTPGIKVYEGDNSATFGLRNGPHMNVIFNQVEIPEDHLVGQEGKGVRQAVTILDHSRTLAAGISVGIARAAFEAALVFARDRVAFDQKVINFQGIQWYFAEMLAQIDGARLLVDRAARSLDSHDQIARWSSEAKLVASSMATEVASRAAQICGAYGIRVNAPFGRFLRDAKAYEIAGGSSEILKNTITKFLLPVAGVETSRRRLS